GRRGLDNEEFRRTVHARREWLALRLSRGPGPQLQAPHPLSNDDEEILRVDRFAWLRRDFDDRTVPIGVYRGFHFHRFYRDQHVAARDFRALRYRDRRDRTRHRRTDVRGIAWVRLSPRRL